MSLFGGEDLFGSGAHGIVVGGLSLRRAVGEGVGGVGVRVSGLGRSGRVIVQEGELLADDPDAMRGLMGAIEAKLDGVGHELVDEHGRVWGGVVMVSFEPGAVVPAGLRWRVRYRVEYLQAEG